MSVLKKLAGQTALYGVSSILGRVLNYLLVPLHTKIFDPAQFGAVTELYAYMAFFNVIFTYGMETTYFRFATKQRDIKNEIFQQASSSILFSSVIFSTILFLLATPITIALDFHNKQEYVYYLAAILFVDAISAIPFAKLRLENKVLLFVSTKMTVILATIVLNFILLLGVKNDIKYVFIANLVANCLIPLILFKEIRRFKLTFNWELFKPMLFYGFPIMVMGLAGMINEVLDRIMLRYFLINVDANGLNKIEAIGIYGACYKLSIFMSLVIQAFRYAAEPFFFAKAQQVDSKNTYAMVMKYFIIACCFILISVTANLHWIKYFLMNELYWQGLIIVPILLLANLFLGVYNNLSIWFKITDKTYFGTIIAILGAFITILFNMLLIPWLGYFGSAITTLVCYSSMAIIAYLLGQKYYPVPYKPISNLLIIISATLLSYLSFKEWNQNFWFNSIIKNSSIFIFTTIVLILERKSVVQLYSKFKHR